MTDKIKKIAFLNPQGNFDAHDSYWTEHPDFGGQLVYVKELACAMSKLGIEADIITRRIDDPDWPEFSGAIDRYPGVDGVRIIRIPCGPDTFLPKEQLWEHLEKWCEDIQAFYRDEGSFPDFWTTHYGDGGISGAMLSAATGIPFSFTGHSLAAQKMDKLGVTNRPDSDLYRHYRFSLRLAAERTAMRYASTIMVSTSMEQKEQYAHSLYQGWVDPSDDTRFLVIPPGVNLSIFHHHESDEDAIIQKQLPDQDLPLIILSSRIDPKKNHISVIRAYAQSAWLREKARLLIVVRGVRDLYRDYHKMPSPEREIIAQWVETIEKEGLKERIMFFDASDQRALASLYRAAGKRGSVFCSTPLYEPFGLTVIEAMGCGLPVLATQNGGPSEILQEEAQKFGILVDPVDTLAIAQGLEKLLGSETLYREYSEKGIQRVHDRYTWHATAKGYLKRIAEILEQPSSFPKPDLEPFRKAFSPQHG